MCSPIREVPALKEGASIKYPKDAAPADVCDSNKSIIRAVWPDPMWQISAHRNCVHNELRALHYRVLKLTAKSRPGSIALLHRTMDSLLKSMPSAEMIVDYHSLIRTMPQSKRRLYTRNHGLLLDEGLAPKDHMVKAFVKMEKLQIKLRDGDPRMIQARSVKFNLALGLYTKAVEKNLYYLEDPQLASMGIYKRLIAKGMNLTQRAMHLKSLWDMMDRPAALSLDLSRWDMHVSAPLIRTMHRWYLSMMPDAELAALLEYQLMNRCHTQGGISYTAPDGVMSGDMTTALGNCVAVIVIVVAFRTELSRLAKEIGIDMFNGSLKLSPGHAMSGCQHQLNSLKFTRSQKEELVNLLSNKVWMTILDDGDDHVLIVEKPALALATSLIPVWWSSLGHVMKVEGSTEDFHQILFCQHKPFPLTGSLWTMMPDPRKVLATSTVITGVYLENPRPYLQTIWDARRDLHKGVPILGPMFKRWAKLSTRSRLSNEARRRLLTGIDHLLLSGGMVPETPITPEKRDLVQQMWNISPDEQVRLELTTPSMPSADLTTEMSFKRQCLEQDYL